MAYLNGREIVHQLLDIGKHLLVDDGILGIAIQHAGTTDVGQVVGLIGIHHVATSLLTIHIHHYIMGNTHTPSGELAVCYIFVLLELADDLDKRLLEDVVG